MTDDRGSRGATGAGTGGTTAAGGRAGPLAVLVDAIADVVNRGLALDPASAARLAALDGRCVQVTFEPPFTLPGDGSRAGGLDLTLTVQHGRLRAYPRAARAPHAIVRGAPLDLLAWLLGTESVAGGRLVIDGDTAVLGELTAILRRFQPDLEGPLGRLLGPAAARQALGTAELLMAGLRSAMEGARRSVRAGAAETFVDRAGAERLLDDLDDLRLRVDRLAARVAAEERRRQAP